MEIKELNGTEYTLFGREVVDGQGGKHMQIGYQEKAPKNAKALDAFPDKAYERHLKMDVPVKLRENARNFWALVEYVLTPEQQKQIADLKAAKETAKKAAEEKAQAKHDRKVSDEAAERFAEQLVAGKHPDVLRKAIQANIIEATAAIASVGK